MLESLEFVVPKLLRLGTRGSALAQVQTQMVKANILSKYPSIDVQIVSIMTQGDRDKSTDLKDLGGKGVFIKELEHALLDDKIDIAVHSFKDVTSRLAEGCCLEGFFTPETQSDVLVYSKPLEELKNPVIGTGSARRQAWLEMTLPNWSCVPIRGNVDTRLNLVGKTVDGVMLSYAGLIRLNKKPQFYEVLDPSFCYPAPGQGVICLETVTGKNEMVKICRSVSDSNQLKISKMEYELLKAIEFDCNIPLGITSELRGNEFEVKWFFKTGGSISQIHKGKELFLVDSHVKSIQLFGESLKRLSS
ncbi:hydroxymethylbilane synthase [bacterium]|nr:hydroxymethylbilane synthase [bacterium]